MEWSTNDKPPNSTQCDAILPTLSLPISYCVLEWPDVRLTPRQVLQNNWNVQSRELFRLVYCLATQLFLSYINGQWSGKYQFCIQPKPNEMLISGYVTNCDTILSDWINFCWAYNSSVPGLDQQELNPIRFRTNFRLLARR